MIYQVARYKASKQVAVNYVTSLAVILPVPLANIAQSHEIRWA